MHVSVFMLWSLRNYTSELLILVYGRKSMILTCDLHLDSSLDLTGLPYVNHHGGRQEEEEEGGFAMLKEHQYHVFVKICNNEKQYEESKKEDERGVPLTGTAQMPLSTRGAPQPHDTLQERTPGPSLGVSTSSLHFFTGVHIG